jgi:hypothetical protein
VGFLQEHKRFTVDVILHELAAILAKTQRLKLLNNLGGGPVRELDVFHMMINVSLPFANFLIRTAQTDR